MNITKKVKNHYINLLRSSLLKPQISHTSIFHCGNNYGGFDIIPEQITSATPIVYSFGIGEDLSFSEAFLKKYSNASVFAFDPTPKSIRYVESHPLSQNSNFHFYPFGLSDKDETSQFYLPLNETHVSGSQFHHDTLSSVSIDVEMKKMTSIIDMLNHTNTTIDVLKIDIEGSEFNVITDILSSNIPFNQLCVEIHDRFFADGIKKLRSLISSLNSCGYYIASISKNYEELTFIKKE